MVQTVWREPVGAVRTAAWYAQVGRRLTPGNGGAAAAVYVVPDAARVTEVVERLLAHPDRAVLGGDVVMPLAQWVRRLATGPTGAGPTGSTTARPPAPRPIRLLAMAEALTRITPRYFTTAPQSLGAARFLLAGITSAFTAGIDPTALHDAAREYGTERELDLAAVAAPYREVLRDTYAMLDPAEWGLLALDAVRSHPLPWRTILLDVGLDPPALVLSLIEAIQTHHPECTLHTIVPTPSALADRLVSSATTTVRDVSPEELEATASAEVTWYRSASTVAEARWVVTEITRRIADGVDPARIGVILPDADQLGLYHRMMLEAGWCTRSAGDSSAEDPSGWSPFDPLQRWFSRDAVWERAPAQATWPDWVTWVHTEMDAYCAPATLGARIRDDTQAPVFIRCARARQRWQQAWTGVTARPTPARPPTLSRDVVRELVLCGVPPDHDLHDVARQIPVQLYPFDALPAHRLNVLFLPGAFDGNLPPIRRTTFFTSTSLPDPLRTTFPTAEQQHRTAALQWARWLAMADQIVASYPESGPGGRPRFPSPLPGPQAGATQTAVSCRPPATPHPLPGVHSVAERIAREATIRRHLSRDDAAVPLLTDPAVIAHVQQRFAHATFSVTDLQTFVTCPFRFFAHTLLGVRRAPASTPDLDHRTRGDWLHRTMARLYAQHAAAWSALEAADDTARRATIAPQVHAMLTATASELRDALARHDPAFRALAQEQLAAMITDGVLADLDHWQRAGAQALRPGHYEWAFGMHDTPPGVLRDGDVTVAIRGQVDRIDSNPALQECLIVDYKTGTDDSISGALQQGQHLPLPLYLEAVRQLLFPEWAPVGALLFHLRPGVRRHGLVRREIGKARFGISGRQGSSMTDEQWDAVLRTAVQSAVAAAVRIRAGDIPWPVHTCAQCDWRELSRYEDTAS